MTVGRFAPSPSGRMHLGNVFSALLAWLSVRSQGGKMILRIEDLDPDRCRKEYALQLMEDLKWLGLDWDEEQTWQSRRSDAYEKEFAKLGDLVYPCYCSRTELHAASAPHASDGRVLYAGTCRNLTERQRQEKTKVPAWRLKVPNEVYGFRDGLQGEYAENLAEECGDFIIRRADGVYAYQLAVVTDDAAGGVTQIVRGSDLLSSTPRQIYLQKLLGHPTPEYYHVPLLIDASGRRLSKRDGDLDLGALREKMTAQELLGRLAWAAGILEEFAPMTAADLVPLFAWDKVKKEDIVIRKFISAV